MFYTGNLLHSGNVPYIGNVLYTRNVGQILQGLFGEDYLEKDAGFKNAIEMQIIQQLTRVTNYLSKLASTSKQ